MSEPWWKSAVVYQIYPRSFCDTSGDGVGDLNGVRRHLDHLAWLGVDAIWLSPIFPSPMKDYGYDVADYCGVDPLFGSLEDFDLLLAEAHARGLRVLLDWVPNHTSNEHPWFVDSRSSRGSARRDWYIWRDGEPDRPPNNWRAAFGGAPPAWTWDDTTQQWYLHLFLAEQPDLNWGNPEVVEAMHDTLRFWLDRGVDGFRMDVVSAIGKDPALPDLPAAQQAIPVCALNDEPLTHDLLRGIRGVLDAYPSDPMMLGEVPLFSTEHLASYYGTGDELHLAFNFPTLYAPWDEPTWRTRIAEIEEIMGARDAWPAWALSNHDRPRHRTRYGSEARARAAAVMLLTLRGTPFLYAGEELGLEDAVVPPERAVDPGGRDGCRAPFPWDAQPGHGWSGEDPWLPWPPQADARNPEAMGREQGSILHLYRSLLAVRRGSPALCLGKLELLPACHGVIAYRRACDGDERVVLVNFLAEVAELELPDVWTVEIASDGAGEGAAFGGRLEPDQALVLRPRDLAVPGA